MNPKMRRLVAPGMVVLAVLMCLVVVANMSKVTAQSPSFSNASLKGSFGFLLPQSPKPTGTPGVTLGVFTFDGVSAVSGSYTGNNNGKVQTGTITGSYSVNADGTASMTIVPSGNGGASITFALVLNSVGKGFQLLNTAVSSGTLDVESGTAIHQ